MAETFLAVQRGAAGFEQRVCVKFILPTLRDDVHFNKLFLREATIAASLRHSNIVGVIDVDQERGYIVLELVDGVDLRALINHAPHRKLPANVVAFIALELCKALSYAHNKTHRGAAAGIVHRDISPSNVLISYSGEVKLADFGIAKAMHSEAEPQSHSVKGKLCYMSPEQTRNEPLDGRSDLFTLGIVCYELLAGRRPFDGQTDSETIIRINQGTRAPIIEAAPGVPGGLVAAIERVLSIDKSERPASADELIDAIAKFADPALAYRQLGEFARNARPHETLSTHDLEGLGEGLDTPKVANGSLRPSAAGVRAIEPVPQSAGSAEETRALAAASRRSSRRSVSGRAWLALFASVVVFAGVTVALITRDGEAANRSAALDTARAPTPAKLPRVSGDALVKVVNAGNPESARKAEAEPAPSPAGAQPAPSIPSEPARSVPTPTPTTPSPTKPLAPSAPSDAPSEPSPRSSEGGQGQATLRVGTMPLGQVWIDGKVAGWSPVVVQLSPGRHVIEGGSDTPQVRKELRLRRGERRQLVLNLEEIATERATGKAGGR